MNHTIRVVATALSVLTFGCNITSAPKPPSAFSDIEVYFQSEIRELNASDLTLSKTLEHKGNVEHVNIEKPDWKKELIPFTEILSDQPAHIQSYKKDSSITGSSKLVLLTARDSSAVVKSLAVYSNDGKNDSIVIIKQVKNSYYSSFDTLTYYGHGNYHLTAENDPAIGKKIGFAISGNTSAKK